MPLSRFAPLRLCLFLWERKQGRPAVRRDEGGKALFAEFGAHRTATATATAAAWTSQSEHASGIWSEQLLGGEGEGERLAAAAHTCLCGGGGRGSFDRLQRLSLLVIIHRYIQDINRVV